MFKIEINKKTIKTWILKFIIRYRYFRLLTIIYLQSFKCCLLFGVEGYKHPGYLYSTNFTSEKQPWLQIVTFGGICLHSKCCGTRTKMDFAAEKQWTHVDDKLPLCQSPCAVTTSLYTQQNTQGTKFCARELFQFGSKHFQYYSLENGKIKVQIKILFIFMFIHCSAHLLRKLPINDRETFPWWVTLNYPVRKQSPIYRLQIRKVKFKANPNYLKIE